MTKQGEKSLYTYLSTLHFVFEHVGDDKIHIGLEHHVRNDDIKVIREFSQNEIVCVHNGMSVGNGVKVAVTKRFEEVDVVTAYIFDGYEGSGVKCDVDTGERVWEVRIAVRGDGYANGKVWPNVDWSVERYAAFFGTLDAGVM